MNTKFTASGLAACCFWVAIFGCSNPMSRSGAGTSRTAMTDDEPDSNIELVSASEKQPVTFIDSERLRYGTGPVDTEAPAEFQVTSSGLRYRILRESRGRKPTASDSVTVNYRGWLDSGKEFDSSYDAEPITFALRGVVAGWTEGMQLIGEGGMIELWVPARLGYGQAGRPGIPPNATLHFIVELIKVM